MIKLRRFLKDYKKECIIGPLCKLFEAILELIVPLVMADIIDNGVTNGDKGYVLRMGLVMVALAATGLLSALVCQYFASKASQGFGTKVRRALFSHINSLSHAELDKLGTPSLITRITNDVNQSQQMVAMTIRLLTRAPFIVIGSIIMAMTISVRMSIIFIIAAVIIGLILYFVMTKSIPIFSLIQKKLDKIGLVSRENLSGNRVIRAFSKQKSEKERIDNSTEDLAATSIRISRLSALLNPATYVVTDVAIIAIIWFGGINVDAGNMQTGDIIALVSYMTQILLAMIVVANLVLLMTKGSASAARINEVLETEPSVKETTKEIISVNTDENTPKIAFDNVSFSYGGGDDAKRTSRQRIVINLMVQKLKQNPTKIPEILDKVMGNVSTSLTKNEILELGMHAVTYTMGTSYAYPFQLCYGENVVNALGEDVVIPVTLEFNVRELHEYLYPGLSYEPSAAVTEYSDYIARKSGYDEDMIGYVLNQGPGAEADSVIAGD